MDGEWSDGAAVSTSTASGGEGKVGTGDGVSADCPGSPSAPAATGRTRRSASKRVVTVPLADVTGPRLNKGVGEGSTSTDEWAWRKYGQKPIKGSPFPRAYYRCSSSKGCPARKQVERSRVEPDKVVVTYSFEHNHSVVVAVPRVQNRQAPKPKARPVPPEPAAAASVSIGTHDVVATCAGVEVHDDFRWLYDGVSFVTSSTSPSDADAADDMMLFGPMFFGAAVSAPAPPLPDEFGDVGALFGGEEAAEEDAMFAGLGELPECAMVFQRHAGGDGLALAGGVKVEQPAEGTAMT